ncbi:MAG: DUF3373 family protein [Thermodesulfobacteriota bacterium]|nr:DUF3373 family protein [Thermodesulfobacteriota bacterium]
MVKRFITYLFIGFAIELVMIPLKSEASRHEDLKLMKEDIVELSDRLDRVETKSILDRVIIGGEFRSRLNYFKYEDTTATLDLFTSGAEDDATTEDIWSNRLRLNLRTDVTYNLVFHGRLTYFKLWGESNFFMPEMDMTIPSIPDSEGNLHVERAYIDYRIPDSHIVISFGRLPTNEGPPNGLRDYTTRKATYPRLFIDGESDGIIASFSLDEWTNSKGSTFRLHYFGFITNTLQDKGVDFDNSRLLVASFETQVPEIKNSFMWISFAKLLDLPTGEAYSDLYGTLDAPPITSAPEDGGHGELYCLHFQFNDINESGLDCFASFALISVYPRSRGTVFGGIYEVGIFGDNLNGDLGESRDGNSIYLGLRYELPIDVFNNPKIGLEYNHSSKYWFGMFSSGSGDLVNKLNVGGDAYEIYFIQPIIEKRMFCRFGGVYMDYDYDKSNTFVSVPDSDMTLINSYLLMDVRF